MRKFNVRQGMALAVILLIMMIILLLGISLVAMTTSQSRYSMKRSGEIITRQAALAGIEELKYQLDLYNSDSWKPAVALVKGIQNQMVPQYSDMALTGSSFELPLNETASYYRVQINESDERTCEVTSRGYQKDSRGNPIREKVMKAIFMKGTAGTVIDISSICTGNTSVSHTTIYGDIETHQLTGSVSCDTVEAGGGEAHVYYPEMMHLLTQINITNSPDIIQTGRGGVVVSPPLIVNLALPGVPFKFGSYDLNSNEEYHGNLYYSGSIHVGGGARIYGNILSQGSVTVDSGAVVTGNVYSMGAVSIREGGTLVTGEVKAFGAVDITTEATVYGSITSAGAVTISGGAQVTGSSISCLGALTISGTGTVTYGAVGSYGAITLTDCTHHGVILCSLGAITITRCTLYPSSLGNGAIVVRYWEETGAGTVRGLPPGPPPPRD